MGVFALRKYGDSPTPIVEHCCNISKFDLLLSCQQIFDLRRRVALAIEQASSDFGQPCRCGRF
jgi:hypothetical protein